MSMESSGPGKLPVGASTGAAGGASLWRGIAVPVVIDVVTLLKGA